jgi:hypothetical protein
MLLWWLGSLNVVVHCARDVDPPLVLEGERELPRGGTSLAIARAPRNGKL